MADVQDSGPGGRARGARPHGAIHSGRLATARAHDREKETEHDRRGVGRSRCRHPRSGVNMVNGWTSYSPLIRRRTRPKALRGRM